MIGNTPMSRGIISVQYKTRASQAITSGAGAECLYTDITKYTHASRHAHAHKYIILYLSDPRDSFAWDLNPTVRQWTKHHYSYICNHVIFNHITFTCAFIGVACMKTLSLNLAG